MSRRDGLALAVLVGLVLVVMGSSLQPGRFLTGGDLSDLYVHQRRAMVRSLAAGRLPLWNPWIFCGIPGLQHRIGYPPNLILGLVGMDAALDGAYLVHLLLGGALAYLCLRLGGCGALASLLGGGGYALSGIVCANLGAGHLPRTQVGAWLPLGLLALERARRRWLPGVILAAGAVGLALLAGHPQFALYGLYGLGLVAGVDSLWELRQGRRVRGLRPVAAWALAAVLGFLLAGVDLVPTAELLPLSSRSAGGLEFSGSSALPVTNLLTLVSPRLMGDGLRTPYRGQQYYWEVTLYVGVVLLVLAGATLGPGLSRREAGLWLLVGTGLLFSLGTATPLFGWAYRWLPGISAFRVPARAGQGIGLALALLGGFGLQRVLGPGPDGQRLRRRAQITATLLGLSLLLAAGLLRTPWGRSAWPSILAGGTADLIRSGLLLGAMAIFLEGARRRLLGRVATGTLLVALCLGDLVSLGAGWLRSEPWEAALWEEQTVDLLREAAGSGRFQSLTRQGDLNQGYTWELRGAGGYDSLNLHRFAALYGQSEGADEVPVETVFEWHRLDPAGGRLGVAAALLAPNIRLVGDRYHPLGTTPDGTVVAYRAPLPRARVVPRAESVVDAEAALALISARDPRETVLVEGPGGEVSEPSRVISMEEPSPHDVNLRLDGGGGGWLVVSDAFYPGWTARVDRESRPIHPGDGLFRVVPLRPGDRMVELRFRPDSFRLGLFVSLGALVLMTALAIQRPGGW